MADETGTDLTKEDVENLNNLIEAYNLLERHTLTLPDDIDLEGAKALLLQHLSKEDRPSNTMGIAHETFKKNSDLMHELSNMCKNVIEKVRDENMHQVVEELNPTYDVSSVKDVVGVDVHSLVSYLQVCQSDMMDTDYPIIVTGNISSGKSSFINMIINDDLLPSHTVHMTSTVCILRSRDEKKIVAHPKRLCLQETLNPSDEVHTFENSAEAAELHEVLTKYMGKGKEYSQIEIFWPVPSLPANIPIIDTPAWNLTKKIVEVSKAVAFICIFNASLAESIFVEIPNYFGVNGMKSVLSLTAKPPLFIFNKYDLVRDETLYRKIALDKLDSHVRAIYNVPHDWMDRHVFKLSVTQVINQHRNGVWIENIKSYDYQTFLSGFQQFLSTAYESKAVKCSRILNNVIADINLNLMGKIQFANLTSEEKRSLLASQHKLMTDMECGKEKLSWEIENYLKEEHGNMVSGFTSCIHSDMSRKELMDCCIHINPVAYTYDRVKELAREAFDSMIVSRLSEKKQEMFQVYIQGIDDRIDMQFKQILVDNSLLQSDIVNTVTTSRYQWLSRMWEEHKYTFSLFMPLSPILSIVSSIKSPVAKFKKLAKRWRNQEKTIDDYKRDKEMYLTRWMHKRIEKTWSKDTLVQMNLAEKLHKELWNKKVRVLLESRIPGLIQSLRRQQSNREKLSPDNVARTEDKFPSLEREFREIIGAVKLFALKNLHEDQRYIPFENLQGLKITSVDEKDDLYKGRLTSIDKENEDISAKCLHFTKSDSTALFFYLSELDIIRKFKHANIVEELGISLKMTDTDSDDVVCLYSITEWCGFTLKDIFLSGEVMGTSVSVYPSYNDTANQICDGLEYLHNIWRYVHRDLKLANIYYAKGRVIKLGGFGVYRDRNTILESHLPPEANDGVMYNTSADIYSFAVVLYEMWYRDHFNYRMKDFYTGDHGHDNDMKPPNVVQCLLHQMMNSYHYLRPDVNEVKKILRSL